VEPGAPIAEDLRQIRRAAARAKGLTQQLLAYGRKQALSVATIDLNAFIGETQSLLRRMVQENVTLDYDLCSGPCWIAVDPTQLQQVLINLTVNAVDAMPAGGCIRFETTPAKPNSLPKTEGNAAPPGVRLVVGDTGSGIPEDILNKVFDPFFTTKGKGTGLGLSTVFGIVAQHDGQIEVSSEIGRGTTFSITLPGSVAPPEGEQPESAKRGEARGHERILVVEDDAVLRESVVRILSRQGYRTISAVDSAAALELARTDTEGFDLLLTDVMLPGISGPQLFERVKAEHEIGRVVFMSGYGQDSLSEWGIDTGAPSFIQKPFAAGELAERVRCMLDTREES
jgi:CheY-like chemotaxis protein